MNQDKNKEKKLDFSLNDIHNGEDDEMELCKKIENSETYARTLLWLAVKFIEDDRTYITNKELSEFLKKIPQRTAQILEVFITHKVLINKKRGHFRATIYFLRERKLLKDCIPIAKKTLKLK